MSAICVVAVFSPPTARAESTLAEMVDAAAQRLQIADDVAAVKWHSGAPVEDPARVQQQLTALASAAEAEDVDPDYVRQIFTDQIAATEAVEHHRFAQWERDPASAPAVASDLAASRARIDGLNHVMLTQVGLHWQLLHSPQCAAEVHQSVRNISAARQFDELYRRELIAATRDYCAG